MHPIYRNIVFLLCLWGNLTSYAESLPRIDIWYEALSATEFNVGSFRLIDDTDTLSLPIEIRRRGASSLYYDKPSYAIKLLDASGAKFDASLLDMRSDNYWILDAMAIDKARMRNRVSMDLWLEFSRKPWYQELEPNMLNGYRGEMVAVYVNDSPQGIYCLMERVDRKQLKLKKYSQTKGVRGLLYKSFANYSTIYYELWNTPDNAVAVWDGWEQSYPDATDGEPISWDRLYRHIYTLTNTTDNTYADTAQAHLDMPVYMDYILFCQLLAARDNSSKNIQVSFYDEDTKCALYTPWDLDHSWGRQYNSEEEPSDVLVKFSGNGLYRSMVSYYHIEDTLASRYAELRSHYFTIEHIDSLFARYFQLFAATGMDAVEAELWSGHNNICFSIPDEQQYIHDWVVERIAYMDKLYNYTDSSQKIKLHSLNRDDSSTKKVIRNGNLYICRHNQFFDILGRKNKD